MKKSFLLGCLCALLLVSCAAQPVSNPISGRAVWLVNTDAETYRDYYSFETEKLSVRTTGESYKDSQAPATRELSVLENHYTLNYSVTTRPAGYLREVDVYLAADSAVTAEYYQGTDTICALTFLGTQSPQLSGELNEEKCTELALSFLPEGTDLSSWAKYYEGNELGYSVVYTKTIKEINTAERFSLILDAEGYVTEARLEQFGEMDAASQSAVDKASLETALTDSIQEAYLQKEENPIRSVKVENIVMGKDLDGKAYYSIAASVEYKQDSSSAPAELRLLYFPSRAA